MPAFLDTLFSNPISIVAAVLSLVVGAAGVVYVVVWPRLFMLGLKNLRRNLVRTVLTCLATVVLVFMITVIWTVIYGLEKETVAKARDFKLIITERWSVPSLLPITHADYLDPRSAKLLPELKGMYGPDDFMTWSFYGGTMDPGKLDPKNILFFFAMAPDSIIPMMDEMEDLDPQLVQRMREKPEGCIVGREKLAAIGDKRVGDRFKLTSINYKDLDLDFEIVGVFPEGRYNQSAIMNVDYFNRAFDKYAREHNNVRHPMDSKRLNLIWVRVRDDAHFNQIGELIENATIFADRPVKVERGSSLVGSFLEAYGDIIRGCKYLLIPAILVIMALVMANAISITVRERRSEMAVLKVLGYRPNQVLALILGEAMLVGSLSGLLSAFLTYAVFNWYCGGIPFRIGFFPVFRIPEYALLWGFAIGAATSFLGSVVPAFSARSVKVSEVFSKVA